MSEFFSSGWFELDPSWRVCLRWCLRQVSDWIKRLDQSSLCSPNSCCNSRLTASQSYLFTLILRKSAQKPTVFLLTTTHHHQQQKLTLYYIYQKIICRYLQHWYSHRKNKILFVHLPSNSSKSNSCSLANFRGKIFLQWSTFFSE